VRSMFTGYIGYMTFILSGVNNQEIHKTSRCFCLFTNEGVTRRI
jgi:hypothetical protein